MNKAQQILNKFFNEGYLTFNKSQLKKLINSGEMLGMVNSNYTDDYASDYKNNYAKTDYMPVVFSGGSDKNFGEVINGKLDIGMDTFSDKNVRATVDSTDPTIIKLSWHSFKTLYLKDKKGTSFYSLPDVTGSEELSIQDLYCLVITKTISSSYRKKYFNRIKDSQSSIDSLISKGYLSKSGSISKTGVSYLANIGATKINQMIKDFTTSNRIESVPQYYD